MRGLLLVCLVGCTGVAAAPAPPPAAIQHPLGAPLVIPDESMIYEIRLRGLHVARVQVAIGQPGWVDQRPAIIIRSRGETDGLIALLGELDWELSTTVDLEHGTPIEMTEHATLTFAGKTETSHQHRRGNPHTVHSAVTALRGWRSAQSQRAELDVRIDRATLGLALHEAARELLDRPAVRYDGVARGKYPFQIWLSDDAARVPLRMHTATKWGAVTVELVEYNAPRD